MKAMLFTIASCLAVALAPAQSSHVLEQQIARGVGDMSMPRVKQLGSGEWLRERLEVDAIAQGVDPSGTGTGSEGVVTARVSVHRSARGSEAMARSERLPMGATTQRYDVELRFAPDTAFRQWIFVGGRYWILDDEGVRRLELTMFPDLLLDAPLDAPHELAWAIMSP